MKGNEGHWGGEISIISQNFSKSPSILFHPLESSISQTSPKGNKKGIHVHKRSRHVKCDVSCQQNIYHTGHVVLVANNIIPT
jgi:hypothetical protein